MKEIKTFGEYFDMFIKNRFENKELEFKTTPKQSEIIKELIDKFTDINIKDNKQFYSEKQLDKVFMYINTKNKWLEPFILNYLKKIEIEEELEWI